MLTNITDGARRRFLNVATGACICVDLPELSGHHFETSTEGLLLLRDKVRHALRLLHPLTRTLTDLPPITVGLGSAYTAWTEEFLSPTRHIYAGISDETSPASVVLLMRGMACAIAYAKPGDERWAVMDGEGWGSLPISSRRIIRDVDMLGYIWYMPVLKLRGRVYLATCEGNILKVSLRPKLRLVPVVVNQPLEEHSYNVVSYLVPPDDHHRSILMVRYYSSLEHLSVAERRSLKCRRKIRDVITVECIFRERRWQLIQVFQVDLAGKRLVPRAVSVGEVACLSLSSSRFPSVAGNAVYLGVTGLRHPPIGVCYLEDKSMDPPYEFLLDDGRRRMEGSELKQYRRLKPELNLVPVPASVPSKSTSSAMPVSRAASRTN